VIHIGNCLETLRKMPSASVDAVVTDPPYGLGKEPKPRDVLRAWLDGEEFKPGGAGFMGKSWDAFVPSPVVWSECLRVLKPGGHLVAFAGSRTYDWIVMGARLAGFEVRDQLIWMYGSGMSKGFNLRRDPDCDAAGFGGFGTGLKPSHEPIVLARKPLSGTVAKNVLEHGTGAINVDGCRVAGTYQTRDRKNSGGASMFGTGAGGGAFVDTQGRWPANLLHDGSPEVLAGFPDTGAASASFRGDRAGVVTNFGGADTHRGHNDAGGSAARYYYSAKASRAERELGLADFAPATVGDGRKTANDTAYQRGKTQRRNVHPTVKPVAVMRWLVRLVGGQPGSVILDPYSGSGTTGIAAALEGFEFVGCELSPEYAEIARARIAHARANPAMWEPDYQAPDEVPDEQLDLFGS